MSRALQSLTGQFPGLPEPTSGAYPGFFATKRSTTGQSLFTVVRRCLTSSTTPRTSARDSPISCSYEVRLSHGSGSRGIAGMDALVKSWLGPRRCGRLVGDVPAVGVARMPKRRLFLSNPVIASPR